MAQYSCLGLENGGGCFSLHQEDLGASSFQNLICQRKNCLIPQPIHNSITYHKMICFIEWCILWYNLEDVANASGSVLGSLDLCCLSIPRTIPVCLLLGLNSTINDMVRTSADVYALCNYLLFCYGAPLLQHQKLIALLGILEIIKCICLHIMEVVPVRRMHGEFII